MDEELLSEIMTRAHELVATKNKKEFTELLKCFDRLYYHHAEAAAEGIPDSFYDSLVEMYSANFGDYQDIQGVGADGEKGINIRKDHKLPYFMGTVEKLSAYLKDAETQTTMWRTKPVDYKRKFDNWKTKFPKGPYTVEGKADGISCLLIYEKTKKGKIKKTIYTRGTGDTGKDLSRYLPRPGKKRSDSFSLIPDGSNFKFPKEGKIVLRGELVMRYDVWYQKYKEEFANPRNIVSGFVTKKTAEGVSASDINFIAYELMVPRDKTRFEQIIQLEEMGFVTVMTEQIPKSQLTQKNLWSLLQKFRANTPYDIDGLVVFVDDKVRPVSKAAVLSSAFAYKVNAQTAIVDVIGVEWAPSSTGALKPRVIYKPKKIGRLMPDGEVVGALYRRATAFNAAFVRDNKIGPGAKLLIVRSGETIPHIDQVLKATKPDLPDHVSSPQPKYQYLGHQKIDFEWGSGGKKSEFDIFSTTELPETKIRKLTLFFSGGRNARGLNIKGLAEKTIGKLYEAGFTTLTDILHVSVDEMKAAGLGKKNSPNFKAAIDDRFREPIDLAVLMGATQIWPSAQVKTMRKILEMYPDIITNPPDHLEHVPGVDGQVTSTFLEYLPMFVKFLDDNPQISYVSEEEELPVEDGLLSGEKIVFTGTFEKINPETGKNYTRPALEKIAKAYGSETDDKINKTTTILVMGAKKPGGEKKLRDAAKFNVKVIGEHDFWNMLE